MKTLATVLATIALILTTGCSASDSAAKDTEAIGSKSNTTNNENKLSGFGTYAIMDEGGATSYLHLDETPYEDDLTREATDYLDKYGDMHVSWANLEIDNTDGTQPVEFSTYDELKIVTEDGKTISADFEPYDLVGDIEDPDAAAANQGADLYEELGDRYGKAMPGTKGETLVMLYAPVETIKSVWLNDQQLSRK